MSYLPFSHFFLPYFRLMRLHQPVGVWLLFWPCAWSVVLASGNAWGAGELRAILLFAVGAVLMRSAGCVINDIADRKIDAQVERTKQRPLASGELSVKQAVLLLLLLLMLSLPVAFLLGQQVVMWAVLSIFPIAIYPLMKRVSWWPQLFLGLVFNWGALMGWAAIRGIVEWQAILLYLGGVCWTLGYDTIYAHQDKIYDAQIGVKSSALRLGNKTKLFVSFMYATAIACFVIALGKWLGAVLFLPVFFHAVWQIYSLNLEQPTSARRIFLSNVWFGGLVFFAIFFGKM